MRLDQGVATQPVPLRGIFLLQCGAELAVRRCSPRAAFCELLPHWSGARLSREVLEHLGFQTQFEHCLAIANQVPVYHLQRPFDFSRLGEVTELVISQLTG